MIREKAYFWPEWFAASLPQKRRDRLKPSWLNSLTKANIYLWRALNIYDDFLDGGGRPEKLPLANSYQRRYLQIFYELPLTPDFYRLLHKIFSGLEAANRQETSARHLIKTKIKTGKISWADNKRLEPPSGYSQPIRLADKSLALALSPLAILDLSRESKNINEFPQILKFFRYILATKQLADDARDWFNDLCAGQLTSVNYLVLSAARRRKINLDLKNKPEIAYWLFAFEAAEPLNIRLGTLCGQARQIGAANGLKIRSRLLEEVIGPIETGLKESRAFRRYWQATLINKK